MLPVLGAFLVAPGAGDTKDACLTPGSGRPAGEGHGNLLQYSCLENPMDRGAWRAMVHWVSERQTTLRNTPSSGEGADLGLRVTCMFRPCLLTLFMCL